MFFFTDTATTEIYTLSLHDALPIWPSRDANPGLGVDLERAVAALPPGAREVFVLHDVERSEEHTSELQSLTNLVCRLLLEKKKNVNKSKCTATIAAAERRVTACEVL